MRIEPERPGLPCLPDRSEGHHTPALQKNGREAAAGWERMTIGYRKGSLGGGNGGGGREEKEVDENRDLKEESHGAEMESVVQKTLVCHRASSR